MEHGFRVPRVLWQSGRGGNSRGVFAVVVNKLSSGSLQSTADTVASMINAGNAGLMIGVAVSGLVSALYWIFVTNTFVVILRRMFLEMRTYEEVPANRLMYLHNARAGRASIAGASARERAADALVSDGYRRLYQNVLVLSRPLHPCGRPDDEGKGCDCALPQDDERA